MSKNTVVMFSMWAPDSPTPIAHRLDKIIRCLNDEGVEVILVSFYKSKIDFKHNIYRHYSLERILPFLKRLTNIRNNEEQANVSELKSVSFFSGVKQFFAAITRCLFAPDINIIFALPTAFLLVLAILRHRAKYVFSVTNPASFACAGSFTGWLLRRNVITDLGDLWYVIKEPRLNFKFEKRFHRWLERSTVQRSNLVTFAYPELMELFSAQYPELHCKMRVMEQGYDGNFISPVKMQSKKNNVFTIGYFGSLRMNEQYKSFLSVLEGFNDLLKENPQLKPQVKMLLAGSISDEFLQKINSPEISDNCNYLGYLRAGELESKMEECDAFIVVTGAKEIPFSYLVPQKLYMYMPYKKPIIYVGYAGKQLQRLKTLFPPVYPFSPEDTDGIKICLQKLIKGEFSDVTIDDTQLLKLDFRNQFKSAFAGYFKS